MVVTAESAQERSLSTGMSEIAAAQGEAVEAVRRENMAWPDAGTEILGVRRTPGRKYGALIWDPLRRINVWLGTFGTAEDAAKAYNAAAAEMQAAELVVKKKAAAELQAVERAAKKKRAAELRAAERAAMKKKKTAAPSEFRGVSQQPSGKYRARIRDPVQRTRLFLGCFDRAEDAANAYDAEAVRLRGERAVTNFKRPGMGLGDFPELPAALGVFCGSTIPAGAQLDDLWTDLPQPELQAVDELLQDMDFTDVAA
uniref:Uncharacterized protein n=1 Tax=Avena sativa TaxID=4498 RepID=A0ACD5YHS0_AVESA